jgi:Tat protein translocase TatB subunit
MIFNVGPAEVAVILMVALIVFGPKRLPEIARQIGWAMREVRKLQDNLKSEMDSVLHPDYSPAPADEQGAITEPDHTALPAPQDVEPQRPALTQPSDLARPPDPPDDGFDGPPDGSFL